MDLFGSRKAPCAGARVPLQHGAGLSPAARRLAAVSLMALVFSGCSNSSRTGSGFSPSEVGVSASPRVGGLGYSGPLPKGGGVPKLGEPYMVSGRMFVPKDDPGYNRTGLASWYGDDFHGRRTANGEIYDMNALTAAHPTLPLPSYAYVTNTRTGRTILVRVNDRGPYVGNRIIDLSKASANALGLVGRGTGEVRVRYAGPAPLDGNDTRERRHLAALNGGRNSGPIAWAEPAPLQWRSSTSGVPASPGAAWSPDSYRSGLLRR